MSDKSTMWRKRVAAWRASGATAAKFSAQHGFSTARLWYWSSRFKREPAAPAVRLMQLVRSPSTDPGFGRRGAIVVDLADVRARITVETGVDRETLSTVVQVLSAGGAR